MVSLPVACRPSESHYRVLGGLRCVRDGAVVADVDDEEAVAVAGEFDGAVAGVGEVPGDEPARVRGEQAVRERGNSGRVPVALRSR